MVGFVVNIDTLLAMVPVLLQEQLYVLTYRFSQDHLELLFNCMRAAGWVHTSQLLHKLIAAEINYDEF